VNDSPALCAIGAAYFSDSLSVVIVVAVDRNAFVSVSLTMPICDASRPNDRRTPAAMSAESARVMPPAAAWLSTDGMDCRISFTEKPDVDRLVIACAASLAV